MDHIRKLIAKRKAIFRDEGRSIRWKSKDKAIKNAVYTKVNWKGIWVVPYIEQNQ